MSDLQSTSVDVSTVINVFYERNANGPLSFFQRWR